MKVESIGIPWYTAETYNRCRSLMIDQHTFPKTFQDWLQRAEQIEADQQRQGRKVWRAHIDPDTFATWCAAHGHRLDTHGRVAYGAWFAAKQDGHFGSHH